MTLTIATVGGACGVLGAVLGIINTWHQINTTRVKLRVVPKVAQLLRGDTMLTLDRPSAQSAEFMGDPATCCLYIEIINLSAFPVTISLVGFGHPDGGTDNPDGILRAIMHKPRLSNGETLPVRLESRELVAAYGKRGELALPAGPQAYVKTDCGTVALGSSPIIEKLWRDANRKQQKAT